MSSTLRASGFREQDESETASRQNQQARRRRSPRLFEIELRCALFDRRRLAARGRFGLKRVLKRQGLDRDLVAALLGEAGDSRDDVVNSFEHFREGGTSVLLRFGARRHPSERSDRPARPSRSAAPCLSEKPCASRCGWAGRRYFRFVRNSPEDPAEARGCGAGQIRRGAGRSAGDARRRSIPRWSERSASPIWRDRRSPRFPRCW